MSDTTPTAIVPFVPGGSDYGKSRALFTALGFQESWEDGGYAGFRAGAVGFILQNLDMPAVASNMMIRVEVPNLDAWWAEVAAKELPEAFPGFRIRDPTEFPWGREVHFVDLAGVCWHVGQGQ
jgi:hypothetical protein